MKRTFRKTARQQIQASLNELRKVSTKPIPRSGWIKVMRQALGMTSYQLANRMGVSQPAVIAFEKSEQEGNITLETLRKASEAMNCRLVYYFIPEKPLEVQLEEQALKIAREKLQGVSHSMALEQQAVTAKQQKQHEEDLAQELLQGKPSKLWEKK